MMQLASQARAVPAAEMARLKTRAGAAQARVARAAASAPPRFCAETHQAAATSTQIQAHAGTMVWTRRVATLVLSVALAVVTCTAPATADMQPVSDSPRLFL